jgi:hypothetical protein
MHCNYEKIQVSSKKTAKTNLGKKSAKLLALSPAAGGLEIINYNFDLSAFIFLTSGVKIFNSGKITQ